MIVVTFKRNSICNYFVFQTLAMSSSLQKVCSRESMKPGSRWEVSDIFIASLTNKWETTAATGSRQSLFSGWESERSCRETHGGQLPLPAVESDSRPSVNPLSISRDSNSWSLFSVSSLPGGERRRSVSRNSRSPASWHFWSDSSLNTKIPRWFTVTLNKN